MVSERQGILDGRPKVNGPDQIYVERKGILALVDARFENKEALTAAVRNLSQYVGKPVSASRPILEGRMPDGSRVEAILPPVAPDGPHVSIRRFLSRASVRSVEVPSARSMVFDWVDSLAILPAKGRKSFTIV